MIQRYQKWVTETTVNQTDSDHSIPETITTPPTPTPATGPSVALCHAVEDTRNKHCRVNLEKHLNMKPDNDIKMDNRDNVNVDNERTPKRSASYSTDSRHAPVNYAKSSISDGGSIQDDTTDSDREVESGKPK